ncbi:SRPBCC family protein [Streptomyces sp. NPDC047070]|uniref:SRPBCC family protein n=1 Tax=Streptomyces sp. NPDC047070 TaxID=3154923 RepID=UPI003455880A
MNPDSNANSDLNPDAGNGHSSHILIPAPVGIVRQILLEPTALAEWNPAFLSVKGPSEALTGRRYPLVARGALRGHWEYVSIGETLVEGRWEVPGLAETNSWSLLPHGEGTHVTHSFTHRGGLAALLRPAFAGVADLRLDRLSGRAAQRALAQVS